MGTLNKGKTNYHINLNRTHTSKPQSLIQIKEYNPLEIHNSQIPPLLQSQFALSLHVQG